MPRKPTPKRQTTFRPPTTPSPAHGIPLNTRLVVQRKHHWLAAVGFSLSCKCVGFLPGIEYDAFQYRLRGSIYDDYAKTCFHNVFIVMQPLCCLHVSAD